VNFILLEPLFLIVFLFGCIFNQNSKYDLQHNYVCCKGTINFGKNFGRIGLLILMLNLYPIFQLNNCWSHNVSTWISTTKRSKWYSTLKRCWPCMNSFTTFILNYCKLINSPISYIDKTQATTTRFSSSVNTLIGPSFLILFSHTSDQTMK
jgi:hypothetical protein